MQNKMHRAGRRNKRAGKLRNVPLAVLCLVVIVGLETLGGGGIFRMVKGEADLFGLVVRFAPVLAGVSLGCALLAAWCSGTAEERKVDTRPDVKARAFGARVLSIGLLCVPIYFLAVSLAFDQQHAAWAEFHGSQAEAQLTALAKDSTLDSRAMLEAAYALQQSIEPTQVRFDGTFFACLFAAAFLHGLPCMAAGVGLRVAPETEAQAKRRVEEAKRLRAKERDAQRRKERKKESDRAARKGSRVPPARPSKEAPGVTMH